MGNVSKDSSDDDVDTRIEVEQPAISVPLTPILDSSAAPPLMRALWKYYNQLPLHHRLNTNKFLREQSTKPFVLGSACSGTDLIFKCFDLLNTHWQNLFGFALSTCESFAVEHKSDKQEFLTRNHGNTAALFNSVEDMMCWQQSSCLAFRGCGCYTTRTPKVLPSCSWSTGVNHPQGEGHLRCSSCSLADPLGAVVVCAQPSCDIGCRGFGTLEESQSASS